MSDKIQQQKLANTFRKKMVGTKYKHFKGTIYQVDAIAVHSETDELRVIYHDIQHPDLIWDRNLEMFLSPVDKEKYPDVTQKLRFEPIKEDKILSQDIALAIKSSDGCYYTGFNGWNKQIRHAKLYHSTKYTDEICNDKRFADEQPYVVKVNINELTT